MNARKAGTRATALLLRASGILGLVKRRRRRRGDFRLFVLEYHDVSDALEPEGVVSSARLGRHLRHLASDYRLATLSDAVDTLLEGPLSADVVVVTFDDGLAGNYLHARPTLLEVAAPATFYLTTGFLDGNGLWFAAARSAVAKLSAEPSLSQSVRTELESLFGEWPVSADLASERLKSRTPEQREDAVSRLRELADSGSAEQPMTWDQAREMAAQGFELGPHTVNHPILSQLDESRQLHEIAESKRRLDDEIGFDSQTFAYPNGRASDFDEITVRILRRLGLKAACTTIRGSNSHRTDLYRLRRHGVGTDSTSLLELRLSGLLDQEVRDRVRSRITTAAGATR